MHFPSITTGCPHFLPPTVGGCRLDTVKFNFCLSVVLGKRIQCCYCIVPCILFWYLPPWRAVVLESSNIAPFCIVLDCDRVLWG